MSDTPAVVGGSQNAATAGWCSDDELAQLANIVDHAPGIRDAERARPPATP
jgi:hypothetical protein